ncbi:MAG: MurR/RpiR family transcriptional regulator [Burkholderiaceae bacterium]|nr:MurR/RpiR family transcriptional regulator [Burkholderiaceae bacterium]
MAAWLASVTEMTLPPEPIPSRAPQNIQELRQLVVSINRHETTVSLGDKALKVVGQLVDRPEVAALGTITELAQMLQVHASTLSRIARSLGYQGFAEFQRVFRNTVADQHKGFYSGQGHRLLDRHATGDDYLNVVAQLAQESAANVDDCIAQLETTELRAATALLAVAPRIRVYGVRQIHAIASLLTYGLGLVRPDVSLLEVPGLGITESLAHMQTGDVLVVSSVSPYSRRVVDVARVAQLAGITVVAITDTRASPLAAHARHAFFIPHQSSFISNSMGAYVVFCEGLINLVAKALDEKALRTLERHEHFIDALNIEMD